MRQLDARIQVPIQTLPGARVEQLRPPRYGVRRGRPTPPSREHACQKGGACQCNGACQKGNSAAVAVLYDGPLEPEHGSPPLLDAVVQQLRPPAIRGHLYGQYRSMQMGGWLRPERAEGYRAPQATKMPLHSSASPGANPFGLDDPRHNLVLLAKELLLLEGHLGDSSRHCSDCMTKHALAASALADEARRMGGSAQWNSLWLGADAVLRQVLAGPSETLSQAVRALRQGVVKGVVTATGQGHPVQVKSGGAGNKPGGVPPCEQLCTGRCGTVKGPGKAGSCWCGNCKPPFECFKGFCVLHRPNACIPNCAVGSCGPDGCGGQCPCPPGQICDPTTFTCKQPGCGAPCPSSGNVGEACTETDGCGAPCCKAGICVNGQCCTPKVCDGISCGNDGCGGSCGCKGLMVCGSDGHCGCPGPAPSSGDQPCSSDPAGCGCKAAGMACNRRQCIVSINGGPDLFKECNDDNVLLSYKIGGGNATYKGVRCVCGPLAYGPGNCEEQS